MIANPLMAKGQTMPAHKSYYSYLLRMWKNGDWRTAEWRVSLENPHTGERTNFPGLRACFEYLERLISATHPPPDPPYDTERNRHPD